jgi:hypothetical protein
MAWALHYAASAIASAATDIIALSGVRVGLAEVHRDALR